MKWEYTDEEATLEDLQKCVGPGWSKIVAEMVEDLQAIGWSGRVSQVKEKFGGLRFYFSYEGIPENMRRIAMAIDAFHENNSFQTCEDCGKYGHARGPGWIRTLCRAHAIEHGKTLTDYEKEPSGPKAAEKLPSV